MTLNTNDPTTTVSASKKRKATAPTPAQIDEADFAPEKPSKKKARKVKEEVKEEEEDEGPEVETPAPSKSML